MDDLDQRHDCGHPLDETTAKDDHGIPLHDYEARSTVCYACAAADEYRRHLSEFGDDSAFDGRVITTRRIEEGGPA